MNGNSDDIVKRVTVIFATMDRPDAAIRLIESIRKRYPWMPIIVGDQNGPGSRLQDCCATKNVQRINLEYDCGVTHARNSCVDAASTEYILLADDDFIFTDETDISIPVAILDQHSSIGIVGGSCFDQFGDPDGVHSIIRRRFEKFVFLDSHRASLTTIPIDFYKPRVSVCNSKVYYECDVVQNFFVGRRSLLGHAVRWDPRFRSNGEHEDFFIAAKQLGGFRVVFSPDFVCYHHHLKNPSYERLRNRQDGWIKFSDKHKVRDHFEGGTGLRSYNDYENLSMGAEQVQTPSQLPARKYSYIRIWPNGEALASPTSPQDGGLVDYDNEIRKYHEARSTLAWKLFRPFMNLERSISKRVKRLRGAR